MGDLLNLSASEARAIRKADKGKEVEDTIESTVVGKAERAGWFTRKVAWTGRTSAPDRVFIKDGRTVWIEFKRAKKKAVGLQAKEGQEMMDHGAEWHSVNTIADGLRILGLDP